MKACKRFLPVWILHGFFRPLLLGDTQPRAVRFNAQLPECCKYLLVFAVKVWVGK
jgi:hypothetical protein